MIETTTSRHLIAAILRAVRAHFSGVEIQVGYGSPYDFDLDEPLPYTTPWILLDIPGETVDATDRQRPGVIASTHRCQLHCALSTRTEQMRVELAEYRSNILSLVAAWETPCLRDTSGRPVPGQRWGLGNAVTPAANIRGETVADALPHGIGAVLIEWEQRIYRPERLTVNDPPVTP